MRSQANVLSNNAQSLWSNLGEQHLALVPELARGATTPVQLQTFMANNPASRIGVTRDKQGFGLNYFVNSRWTAFFNASHEQREGSRPFGGPFSSGVWWKYCAQSMTRPSISMSALVTSGGNGHGVYLRGFVLPQRHGSLHLRNAVPDHQQQSGRPVLLRTGKRLPPFRCDPDTQAGVGVAW